ncbi:hypothetical protein D3C75_699260 [compost metagenome]
MRISGESQSAVHIEIRFPEPGAARILVHEDKIFAGYRQLEAVLSRCCRMHPVIWEFRSSEGIEVHFYHLEFCICFRKTPCFDNSAGMSLAVQQTGVGKILPQNRRFIQYDIFSVHKRFIGFGKQEGKTVRHYPVALISRMIDIVEKLPFRDNVPLGLAQAELPGYCVLYAHHGKIIVQAHRREPFLQVPVIHKHAEQQNNSRPVVSGQDFQA